MYETDKQYSQRILEWEATKPQDVEITVKGNAMTAKYYTDRVLPQLVLDYQAIKRLHDYQNVWFQEDNDPSHGTRSKINLPRQYKEANWIAHYTHPAQSPDLNPIEAIWNILKQRLTYRWSSIDEMKAEILRIWDSISLNEIRARIDEMPSRCKQLRETNGKAIKSMLW
jgi:transposase